MASSEPRGVPLERVPTGVPGLDEILNGGLLGGGTYIIQGSPGAGKTILGNQICFHHVSRGGRAVYTTLLAETHARLLAHIGELAFFRADAVGRELTFLPAYRELEQSGLGGLLEVIRRVFRESSATFLVLDGLVSAAAVAESELAFKKFINELNTLAGYMGWTSLLLANRTDTGQPHPEHTMVDGLLELHDEAIDVRASRELVVRKFRGSDHLRGRHHFDITARGVHVHPRTEARVSRRVEVPQASDVREPLGLAALDRRLRGGVPRGSSTLLLGPHGRDQTLVGLRFLAEGLRREQPGVCFGFFASPPRLLAKATHLGLPLAAAVQAGSLVTLWSPPVELELDVLAEQIVAAIARTGAKRVYLDGLTGFEIAASRASRLPRFFAAFTHELRVLGVTLLVSAGGDAPGIGLRALFEHVVTLRQVDLDAALRRKQRRP